MRRDYVTFTLDDTFELLSSRSACDTHKPEPSGRTTESHD